MTNVERVEQLKIERRTATPERQEQIDTFVKRLEPHLTHEEAAFITREYESGLRRRPVKVDGHDLYDLEPIA